MCLIGSGCLFKNEYRFQKAIAKKRLENGNHGSPCTPQFHRGVLCAEQLKLVRPESVSGSIVIETPRRNFPSIRSRTALAAQHNESGSCKRISILKDSAPDVGKLEKKASAATTQRVSITTRGVTYKTGSDHSPEPDQRELTQVTTVESQPRKVSPADSGMYSASSAKSVDWDTRDASLDRTPSLAQSQQDSTVVEEEDVDTEGTLEEEEERVGVVLVTDKKTLIGSQPEL